MVQFSIQIWPTFELISSDYAFLKYNCTDAVVETLKAGIIDINKSQIG